jgi:hypothetical protein
MQNNCYYGGKIENHMETIGSYNSQNIPLSLDNYATLYLYLKDREVIIYCKRNLPYYHVEYVAVCIEQQRHMIYTICIDMSTLMKVEKM